MLLRRSGEKTEKKFNLAGITGAKTGDIGVSDEGVLVALAEAVCGADSVQIKAARNAAVDCIGGEATVDVIGIAAAFNGITKVANATGLPLDDATESSTQEMRESAQIDLYSDSYKSKILG